MVLPEIKPSFTGSPEGKKERENKKFENSKYVIMLEIKFYILGCGIDIQTTKVQIAIDIKIPHSTDN